MMISKSNLVALNSKKKNPTQVTKEDGFHLLLDAQQVHSDVVCMSSSCFYLMLIGHSYKGFHHHSATIIFVVVLLDYIYLPYAS